MEGKNELSQHTKIQLGLVVTVGVLFAGIIFQAGYFLAVQDSMSDRIAKLEDGQSTINSIQLDVATIKTNLTNLNSNVISFAAKLDQHVSKQ
jgi:hypothetical protein